MPRRASVGGALHSSRELTKTALGLQSRPVCDKILKLGLAEAGLNGGQGAVLINDMSEYLPVFVLLALSTGLSVLILGISVWFGPRRRAQNATKISPYESGMKAIGQGQRRLPVRFNLIGILFILFDVEVIFFLPWAVAFRKLGTYGLIEMLVFMAILFAGYIWIWKKGALEWETTESGQK
jgi:NADH-quinone oxidoreductase subunit A